MFDGLIFLQEMVKSLYIIILSLCYFMIVDAKPPVVYTHEDVMTYSMWEMFIVSWGGDEPFF